MALVDYNTACIWAVTLLTVWYLTSSLAAWYRLRHIPGPRLASFSYLWDFYTILSSKTFDTLLNLRDYGPLVRIAPGYIVTDDPDVLRKTMALRGSYTRDAWYSAAKFTPDSANMATQLNTAAHDVLKAKTASGYGGRQAGMDPENAIDSQIVRLIDLIERKYISKGDSIYTVDLGHVSRYFSLDVISLLLFNKAWGHLDEGVDVLGWVEAMDFAVALMTVAMEIPLLRAIIFSRFGFLYFFGPKTTDKYGLGVVIKHVNKLIRERFEKSDDLKPQEDMMSGFIRNGMTEAECQGESMLAIFAGNDTSAAVIRSTMLHLILTPHAYSKFKSEIQGAIERGEASSPITNKESLQLPYTQAIVWEGFRLGAPTTFGHYKVVPPAGETIHGKFLPGGTRIGHNTVAMTQNKRIFGQDANVFRPERFIECEPEKKIEMMKALEMVFGGGRWMCSGKNIAIMELNKVFFELMRAFDFQLVNPLKPAEEEVYFLRQHKNMLVRITRAN